MKAGLILYGANGYTGRLVLEVALREGLRPTLAGRRAEAIERLAEEHGLPFRVFALESAAQVAREVEPFGAVLLAAGPFSKTSAVAAAACLSARASYLDITGEVDVFEALFARDAEAREAGIAILPGVGFDVVPSDCLASSLADVLPGGERLELAFRGFKASPGTLKTMLEGASGGGRARIAGRLVAVPVAWKTKTIPFADKPRLAMTIPWGDLATAWRSTGIPNIETYMAMSASAIAAARRTALVAPLLRLGPVQAFLKRRIEANVAGPSAAERSRERSQLWGRVTAKDGRSVEGTLETLEGYTLTAEAAVAAAKRVLAGAVKPGVSTPSQAFGPRFIETIRETRLSVGPVVQDGPSRR